MAPVNFSDLAAGIITDHRVSAPSRRHVPVGPWLVTWTKSESLPGRGPGPAGASQSLCRVRLAAAAAGAAATCD